MNDTLNQLTLLEAAKEYQQRQFERNRDIYPILDQLEIGKPILVALHGALGRELLEIELVRSTADGRFVQLKDTLGDSGKFWASVQDVEIIDLL